MKKLIKTKSYVYNITTPDGIESSKIWRKDTIPESTSLEYKFNNPKEYIKDNLNSLTTILEEYPEYLAGWQTIITNTGLVCFYNSSKDQNNFVIYDIFDDDVTPDGHVTDSSFLSDIKPDISMLKMYNIFEQPLSVRKINFTNNEFTPERSYNYYNKTEKKNKWCGFFNCDGINNDNNITLNDNFFFEFNNKYFSTSDTSFQEGKTYYEYQDERYIPTSDTSFQEGKTYYEYIVKDIQFNYKPLFVFRIYNTNGTEKDNATIIVDGVTAEKDSNGIYFIDLSARESKGLVSISLQSCNSGYLEVI